MTAQPTLAQCLSLDYYGACFSRCFIKTDLEDTAKAGVVFFRKFRRPSGMLATLHKKKKKHLCNKSGRQQYLQLDLPKMTDNKIKALNLQNQDRLVFLVVSSPIVKSTHLLTISLLYLDLLLRTNRRYPQLGKPQSGII